MKTDRTKPLVELGSVRQRTLGAEGPMIDLVRMMQHWGIGED